MNRLAACQSSDKEQKILSTLEKEELLSLRGIAVSRVAEILWLKTITLSSRLKKIWMRNHFSEATQGTTRIIKLTNMWVEALLEVSKPTTPKKSTAPQNISPIKPDTPGIFLVDFQEKLSVTTNSATEAWNNLLRYHFWLFTTATSPKHRRTVYKLKGAYEEEAIRLAREYLQRKENNTTKAKGGNTSDSAHQKTMKYFSQLNHG